MRIAGLDPGERRIGVAISVGATALPLEVIERDHAWKDRLGLVIQEYEVGVLVVGVPLALAGHPTGSTKMARRFIAQLKAAFSLPVIEADERFSSSAQERALREIGVSSRDQRGRIDDLAAADILQHYLDGASHA